MMPLGIDIRYRQLESFDMRLIFGSHGDAVQRTYDLLALLEVMIKLFGSVDNAEINFERF